MKELPYFKFEPNEWITGSIQFCSYAEKGIFVEICCFYWSRGGDLNKRMLCRYPEDAIKGLKDAGVIEVDDDQVSIKFLDAQLAERAVVSKKLSLSAKKRWEEKRRKNVSGYNEPSNSLLPSHKEATTRPIPIEENRIEKNKVVGTTTPPSLEVVIEYFEENGFSKELAVKAFNYYETSRGKNGRVWKDGKGNTIKNWKMKKQSVWFKDENKIQDNTGATKFDFI